MNKNCMFLHEAGEDAESFSRMELSTANSRQTREQAHAQLPPPPRPPVAAAAPSNATHPPPTPAEASQMARSASHINDDGSSALPVTANWAKNPPTPATRPASLVHQIAQPPKVSTPSPKITPAQPLPHNPKPSTSRKKQKNVGVIGEKIENSKPATPVQPAAAVAGAPPPKLPPYTILHEPVDVTQNRTRWNRLLEAISRPGFGFKFDASSLPAEEYEALCNVPPMWDKLGGRKRREALNKVQEQSNRSEISQEEARQPQTQAPVAPPPMGVQSPAQQQQQQQREAAMMKDTPSQSQNQALQAMRLEAMQQQQQQNLLRSLTPQALAQQAQGGFTGFQNGPSMQQQNHQSGHARQSSRYTFNDAGNASTQVNARSNAAHMDEQIRMMPTTQQQQQQLSHLYNSQPLTPGLMGTIQQPPPGLKSAPTPPAPGLSGIPMGNMPGMNQFSGLGHQIKSDHGEVLLRELMGGRPSGMGGGAAGGLMRGMDGKRNVPFSAGAAPGYTNRRGIVDHLTDPGIIQSRMAPQHQLHQQGIQAGGHGQPGGYTHNNLSYYAGGRW